MRLFRVVVESVVIRTLEMSTFLICVLHEKTSSMPKIFTRVMMSISRTIEFSKSIVHAEKLGLDSVINPTSRCPANVRLERVKVPVKAEAARNTPRLSFHTVWSISKAEDTCTILSPVAEL